MRVFVTGASGFIGSILVPLLGELGHQVGRKQAGAAWPGGRLDGIDAVVHLANVAHRSAEGRLLWEINVDGTRRLAELAARRGVKRFVYLSSVHATGDDAYGRAKLAAERALAEVAARSKLEPVVLRPPLVYGPGVKANFLSLMRAIASGWPLPLASVSNRRSLVYVGNLCDAISCCLESKGAIGRTYFVTDGAPVNTPALCRALGDAMGRPARLFPFPPLLLDLLPAMRKLTRSLEVDDSAIRRELGWRPPIPFEEGLRLTAEWYRAR